MTVLRTVTAFLRQRRTPAAAGVALLLVLHAVLAFTAAYRNGVTADEVVHLTGGYSYWRFNDYRLQPENGTLPMRIAALPLLAMDLRWVASDDPHWRNSIVNRLGHDFFFTLGNPLEGMLLAGRLMITGFGLVTLCLIWRWSRGLFGKAAGWLSLTLAALCPALLAHGALVTSDMAITACLLAVVTAFWLLLHRVTWPRLAAATAAGGWTTRTTSRAAARAARLALAGDAPPSTIAGRGRWAGRGRTCTSRPWNVNGSPVQACWRNAIPSSIVRPRRWMSTPYMSNTGRAPE